MLGTKEKSVLGSILISGRRTGQARLDLTKDGFSFVPTKPKTTFEDILSDTQEKLDSIKASPSPVEAEIKFLEEWLFVATVQSGAAKVMEEVVKEVEKDEGVIPISSGKK